MTKENNNSVIKSINNYGQITEHCFYTLDPFKALICYLEQTINNNYNTWGYFENVIDRAGKEHNTKSKFIDLIKPLPSKKGYAYIVPDSNSVICAYAQ